LVYEKGDVYNIDIPQQATWKKNFRRKAQDISSLYMDDGLSVSFRADAIETACL
jgi:hypothetical protein